MLTKINDNQVKGYVNEFIESSNELKKMKLTFNIANVWEKLQEIGVTEDNAESIARRFKTILSEKGLDGIKNLGKEVEYGFNLFKEYVKLCIELEKVEKTILHEQIHG